VRRRVVLLFGLGAMVTAGVLIGLLVQLRSDAIDASKKLLTAVAQLTDEQTSRTLQSVERVVQSVGAILADAALAAAFPTLAGEPSENEQSIDVQLRKLAAERPFLTSIRVLDRHGLAIHGSDIGHDIIDLSDRAYFTERRADPGIGFQFEIPLRNRSANKWIIPAAQTVRAANGDFDGVIVAAVDSLHFNRVWSLDEEIPKLSITLFRTGGVMLMRTPFDEKLIGRSFSSLLVFREVEAGGRSGTFQTTSRVDGEKRLFAYRRLSAYPDLVLVTGQNLDQVLTAWWRIAWFVAFAWVAAMLVVGALTLWVMREWVARRAVQDRYRMLFESNPFSAALIDGESRRFLAVNDAAVVLYGWSREEFLTMTSSDLYLPADLAAAVALRSEHVPEGTAANRVLRHRRKDGTAIDVETSMRRIEIDGRPTVLALAQDVTKRGIVEQQLRQSQKMEAVGQLTGGIAHDFNNILTVIMANADALQEEETLDAAMLATRLEQITQAVLRASELTRQLVAFSRKQSLNPKRTNLNDLVTSTGKLLRRALGENIEIDSTLTGGLWTVNVDRAQLETALLNLCVNARDAMPGGGKLSIETRNITLDKNNVTQVTDVADGDFVMLCVTDTGVGMAPETRAKVFEPFFTTKEVGKGTGLGLSMVYGFIKQSKGHITIHSEVGRGTTFKLYLPRSDGVQEEATVRSTAPMPRGSERILVVEDELQVRASVVEQLQSLGYAVTQVADGTAGLAAFAAAPQPYDLLLTDLVMPGPLSGRALADEVTRRWPATRIVFVSGYAEITPPGEGTPGAAGRLLSKPFRKRDLALFVRQTLDAGPDHALPQVA